MIKNVIESVVETAPPRHPDFTAMRDLQEPRAEKWNNGHGHDERSDQGNAKHKRKRGEQELAHSIEKCDREKIHNGNERCGEYCDSDFGAADFSSDTRHLAEFQVPVDVLQRDDGVVDDA